MKERKRKITIITIIGVMLILAITTFTYAIWSRTHTQTGINKNTYACFDISYEETNGQGITMDNGFPQKDEDGLKNKPYEVEIKNKCDTVSTYNVILNKQEGSTLKDEHLKVAVDNDYKLLSKATPTDKREIEGFSNEKSYIIGTGVIGPKQTKIVQIRSWMDKDTTEQEGENKSFTFKITIEAVAGVGNLKTKIFGKEFAVMPEMPDFSISFPNQNYSEEEVKAKSGLYLAFDDDGDTYYFRGKVENNYVKLSQDSNLVWRIIRKNGDGTIRIILNDKTESLENVQFNENGDNPKYVGYTYDNNEPCTKDKPCISNYDTNNFINSDNMGTNSNIKTKLEDWYQSNLANYDDKIALTTFCNDTSYGSEDIYYTYYAGVERLTDGELSLLCSNPTDKQSKNISYGGVYKLKIGLISGDELFMAGFSWYDSPVDNYLYKLYKHWIFTPATSASDSANLFEGTIDGGDGFPVYDKYAVLPVINLKSDVTVTGSGTEQDPYVVQ